MYFRSGPGDLRVAQKTKCWPKTSGATSVGEDIDS